MKRLLLSLILACAALQAQAPTNLQEDFVSDSTARITYDLTAAITGFGAGDKITTVWRTVADGNCSSGTGNAILNITIGFQNSSGFPLYSNAVVFSGLPPNTDVNLCIGVKDNGSSSITYDQITVHTLARTQTEPTPPTEVSTTYPTQSGTTYTVPTGDCENVTTGLQPRLNTLGSTLQYGDTIIVPKGTVCRIITLPDSPTKHAFIPSDVQTSTSILTWIGHGVPDNGEIHFAAPLGTGCLPGNRLMPSNRVSATGCERSGGWSPVRRYYCGFVDVDHCIVLDAPSGNKVYPGHVLATFNLSTDIMTLVPTIEASDGWLVESTIGTTNSIPSGTSFQLAPGPGGALPVGTFVDTDYTTETTCTTNLTTNCATRILVSGSPVNITSNGTPPIYIVDRGTSTMYVDKAHDHSSPWVLIKSDGNLVFNADGRFYLSDNTGEFFDIKKEARLGETEPGGQPYYAPSVTSGIMTHNIRMEGVRFTTDALSSTDHEVSTDPRPWCNGPQTKRDNRNIVFNKWVIDFPGAPHRIGCAANVIGVPNMFLDGVNVAFTNGEIATFNYPKVNYGSSTSHGFASGGLVASKTDGDTVSITAGVARNFVNKTTTSGTTVIDITPGSGVTGTGRIEVAMDGKLKVKFPNGVSGTCMSSGSIVPSGTYSCDYSNAATPTFATTTLGSTSRSASIPIASVSIVAGVISSVTPQSTVVASVDAVEGANPILIGPGPGPFLWKNIHYKGSGLMQHFDEGGGTLQNKHDVTIIQSWYEVDPATAQTKPTWDGFYYAHRQPFECKDCSRVLIKGNLFTGCNSSSNNPTGICMAFTPRSGGRVDDLVVESNRFWDVDGVAQLPSPANRYHPISVPAMRMRFSNNLSWVNGPEHYIMGESFPLGYTFYGSNAVGTMNISNNTFFDGRGNGESVLLRWDDGMIGGLVVQNNFYFRYAGSQVFKSRQNGSIGGCPLDTDEDVITGCFLDAVFTHNVVVPSWSTGADTTTPSGKVSTGTVSGGFPTKATDNFFPNESSVENNIEIDIKWTCALVNFTNCYTVDADFSLQASSAYKAGGARQGSDGLAVGVNYATLLAAMTGEAEEEEPPISTLKRRYPSLFRNGNGRR